MRIELTSLPAADRSVRCVFLFHHPRVLTGRLELPPVPDLKRLPLPIGLREQFVPTVRFELTLSRTSTWRLLPLGYVGSN